MKDVLTYDLDDDSLRPLVVLHDRGDSLALLDTGAFISVWTDTEENLKKLGAVKRRDTYRFSGFGGKDSGALYSVDFRLGKLLFRNMPIVVKEGFSDKFIIILAATLFENLLYVIDNVNSKLIVAVPDNESYHRVVKFIDESGKPSVFASDKSDDILEVVDKDEKSSVSDDESFKAIAAAFRDLYDKK